MIDDESGPSTASSLPGRPLVSHPDEKTPLLATASKGKQRDVESSSGSDEDPWTIESLADALAIELWRRDPGNVLTAHDIQEGRANLAPILAAHSEAIDSVFPPRTDISTSASRDSDSPVASTHSTALLLAAALTLLDRSTSLRDPPTRGELGVERAIRARATREKLQLALVGLTVRLLDEPLDRDTEGSDADNRRPGEVEDEAVSVLWTEFKIAKGSERSACGSSGVWNYAEAFVLMDALKQRPMYSCAWCAAHLLRVANRFATLLWPIPFFSPRQTMYGRMVSIRQTFLVGPNISYGHRRFFAPLAIYLLSGHEN
jgi:hypothetical protein